MSIEQILLSSFGVSESDIEKAKTYQAKYGGLLTKILVSMGSLPDDVIHEVMAEYLGIPIYDPLEWNEIAEFSNTPEIRENLVKYSWFPIKQSETKWVIVCTDPLAIHPNNWLEKENVNADILIASTSDISSIASNYDSEASNSESNQFTGDEEEKLRELAAEAPTVNLLNSLIGRALRKGASDMHLEPFKGKYRARFRIDGVLHEEELISKSMELPIVTRLKILSGMDIAEKRRPQDGKIETKVANQEIDIRVSALPLNDGESVVMRFLKKENVQYDMSIIGLSPDVESMIRQDIKTTAGVVLLTGPTGSGKTTTLYTFLNALNNDDVKIITLEDPVEYQLPGINQVQVNSEIGFDFAAGLRSIVRQDPDVIMLGEIRDKETAQIALQSALTGHLVFSTVHTNDAASAYTRLLDLGVEEFLLNAALVSIVAQRLARKVCSHCTGPIDNADEMIAKYNLNELAKRFSVSDINLCKGAGCEHCGYTGYKGRLAITEYLACDDEIKAMPKNSDFIASAKRHNHSIGRRTLLEDGLFKALNGLTTVDEVVRVAG